MGDETIKVCQECGGGMQPRWETMQIEEPYLKKTFDDKYLTTRLIGKGGMSRVYEAKHLSLEKTVCIKVLVADVNMMEQLVPRFRREADAICRLNHPNIVQVLDFGQAPQTSAPYLVMEYVPGRHLGQFTDEEYPLQEKRIVHVISQTLSALAEAHAAGIVHRDLKPANIIVTPLRTEEDFVKVLDFGIAKILDDPEADKLTRTGMLFGTPEYMAPEQARGDEVDHRADIYSIGVILYRMVTGRTPFVANTPMGTLTKHLTEKPTPPNKLEGIAVSRALEAVIMKALEKDPARRQANALAMQKDLQAALDKARPSPSTVKVKKESVPLALKLRRQWWRRKRWRRPAIYICLALLLAGGLALLWAKYPTMDSVPGLPEFGPSTAGPLPSVQALIRDGRLLEAEALLKKQPGEKSPTIDAVHAQILLFSEDPEMRRGTELIQDAVIKQPELLDYASVRQTLVRTLDTRSGKKPIQFVVNMGGRAVIDELVQAATDRRYWLRWNSIEALKQLGELGRVDKVMVYIADLKYAGSCNTRKRAARELGKIGDDRALEPLRKAQERGFIANLCMGDALEEAIRQIEE